MLSVIQKNIEQYANLWNQVLSSKPINSITAAKSLQKFSYDARENGGLNTVIYLRSHDDDAFLAEPISKQHTFKKAFDAFRRPMLLLLIKEDGVKIEFSSKERKEPRKVLIEKMLYLKKAEEKQTSQSVRYCRKSTLKRGSGRQLVDSAGQVANTCTCGEYLTIIRDNNFPSNYVAVCSDCEEEFEVLAI